MIFFIELLIKILIFLLLFIFLSYKSKVIKKITTKLMFIAVCIAFFSFGVSSICPSLTETVTITALGEKNISAQSDEIILLGMVADGQNIEIGTPKTGKWFWGRNYMWRNETDSRQPDGTTRSIVFNIPVGVNRQIVFCTDIWNGLVKIECLDNTQIIDTYSDDLDSITVILPKSSTKTLIYQSILNIVIFSFVLCFTMGVFFFLIQKLKINIYDIKKVYRKYNVHLVCGLISLITFIVMVQFSKGETLWNDEIWQIWFSMENESLINQLLFFHSSYYPSLAGDILALWYYCAPYGEHWLLLPLEISTVLGVYILSLASNKINGYRLAVLTSIFGGISSNLIFQGAYEFRGYGFLFLACCITVYIYVYCRSDSKINYKRLILFGLALWLPTTFHIFGVFFCTGLVLTDLIYMLIKRLSLKWLWSYSVAIILYLPWVYNMLCYDVFNMDATWQGKPSLNAINSLLRYLTNYNNFYYVLFWIGFVLICVKIYLAWKNKQKIFLFEVSPLVIFCFVISFVYIYGKFINPTASMWMERYFIVLFPTVIYMQAVGANVLCDIFHKQEVIVAVCLALTINMGIGTMGALEKHSPTSYQHFKEAADWFYTQQNIIYNDDTLIIYAPDAPVEAWQEYYTTKQGVRDPLEVISQYTLKGEDLRDKNFVYVYYEHIGMLDSTRELLESNGFYESANDEYLKVRTFMR